MIEVRLTVSNGGRINRTVSDDGAGLPSGFEINESKTLNLRLVKILTEMPVAMNPGSHERWRSNL